MKKFLYFNAYLFLFVLFVPAIFGLYLSPFEFNQFLIERSNAFRFQSKCNSLISQYKFLWSAGFQSMLHSGEQAPDFNKPEEMFTYVFSHVPYYAKVYPSEGFYYWNFKHPTFGSVAGNIRLADLEKKQLISFAYFPVGDEWTKQLIKGQSIELNPASGLSVEKKSSVQGGGVYSVSYAGITRTFELPVNSLTVEAKLYPSEEFVGKIMDEGGIAFDLIYNQKHQSFYDILDRRHSLAEPLISIGENILIGARSRFAYYHDQKIDRLILVGVENNNSRMNNYFDGPGDQVPFWLDIKEKLNKAYPASMLGDGIDAHGVYINKKEWTRLAITPFQFYSKVSEMKKLPKRCSFFEEGADKSACLTKEWWNSASWLRGVMTRLEKEGKETPSFVHDKLKSALSFEQKARLSMASL